jgi:(1->4)-alpha-D-glucan 1-alpha-D-glucosylmutase
MQRDHPAAMTVLSTHDTKRSADARARLTVLAELPDEWRAELAAWTKLLPAPDGDSNAAYLVFQTALAAWPIDADRLAATALKSVREAKLRTSWTSQEAGYERAVEDFARAVPDTPELAARITAFAAHLAPYERTNTLSAALLHLTMPGVPDLYQGSEHPLHTLVDPDNRHPVAFALASRGAGNCANTSQAPPAPEKLHVTATALHLRRTHPEAFTGPYTPLPTHDNAIAYLRGDDVLAVATRLPHRLEQTGWGGATLPLPPGQWTDALTEGPSRSGEIPLATLLAHLPVALLVRTPQEP